VLVTAVILLTAATLLTLTMVNESTISLKIVQNTEMALEAEEEAQAQIERLLDQDLGQWPPDESVIASAHYQGTLYEPECVEVLAGGGASSSDLQYMDLVSNLSSGATAWTLRAEVTENVTGARASVHQGITWSDATGVVCP
jgi:hypothetical protein